VAAEGRGRGRERSGGRGQGQGKGEWLSDWASTPGDWVAAGRDLCSQRH
jgi:hypothetical protein